MELPTADQTQVASKAEKPKIAFETCVDYLDSSISFSCQGHKLKGFKFGTDCTYQVRHLEEIIIVPQKHTAPMTEFPIIVDATGDKPFSGTWWIDVCNFEKTGRFEVELILA